ncbi:hypothetical protein QVD17_38901 [Tagetes erecta]|uniref:Uncharacterized protein n=1 Tax=Tagetes erecta TaxID=13708 RepID=A0AAD8JML4_TARER|nr:hypothetical protein QVD17_38901 [Tagetes erecta]
MFLIFLPFGVISLAFVTSSLVTGELTERGVSHAFDNYDSCINYASRSVRSLITIGGVDIVVPGMFYGRDMAVHGLGGILEYRHHTRSSPANLSGNFTSPNRSSPPIYNITGNYTFQFPVAIQSPLSSHRTQNQIVLSPDPSSTTNGTDKHVHSSSNQTPIRSASVDFKAEEHKSRVKLLEVSTESTGLDDEAVKSSFGHLGENIEAFLDGGGGCGGGRDGGCGGGDEMVLQ